MNLTVEQILTFLREVDGDFPTPLSQKQDLLVFSRKLSEKATICSVVSEERILAMVAGYTENVVDRLAYISIVATVEDAKGRGYASRLVKEFIDLATKKDLEAVHLYTAPSNEIALRMYEKLGFVRWIRSDELRPDDVHLICWIRKEGSNDLK